MMFLRIAAFMKNRNVKRLLKYVGCLICVNGLFAAGQAMGGYSLQFGGAEYVSILHDDVMNVSAVTLEMWFYWDNTQQVNAVEFLIGKDTEQLEIHTGGGSGNHGLRFIPTTGVYLDTPTYAFSSTNWHHVAFVYDPAQSLAKGYVDGVEVSVTKGGSNPIDTLIKESTVPLRLGVRNALEHYLTGRICDVRVWNTVRTGNEIQTNMHRRLTGNEPGLVAYYRMDEGSGTVLGDSGPNGLGGAIVGASWVEDSPLPDSAALASGIVAHWNFDTDFTATLGGATYNATGYGGVTNDRSRRRFDGASAKFDRSQSGYLRAESSPFTQSNYTYAAWYYLDVEEIMGDNRYFILEASNGSNWPASYGLRRIDEQQSGQVHVSQVSGGGVYTNFPSGTHRQWHHIAVTFDASAVTDGDPESTQFRTYLDGVLVDDTLKISAALDVSSNLVIGGHRDGTGRNWHGWIDEVAVWDRVLTETEITWLQSNPIVQAAPEVDFDRPMYGHTQSLAWGTLNTATSGYDVEISRDGLAWAAYATTAYADATNLTVDASEFESMGTIQFRVRARATGDHGIGPWGNSAVRTVAKAMASVVLADLVQTYDGTVRSVTATSDPADLVIDFTYDGNAWAPTNAGSYAVAGTVVDTNWEGFAEGTLVVAKAAQTITFEQIVPQLTTNVVMLSATASPSGLPVTFSVDSGDAVLADGTNLTFTGAGGVSIVASQAGDTNWLAAASVTNTFEVSLTPQPDALVFAPPTPQTFNTTNALSTSGGTGTGLVSYTVLSGPGEIVDGTNLLATSGTGEFNIQATKAADTMYAAQSVISTVEVRRAPQTINFTAIGQQFWTNSVAVSATASSGLGIALAVGSGPAILAGSNSPTTLTFDGYGAVSIVASQTGDTNWLAAASVTNTFDVIGPELAVLGTNDAVVVSGNEIDIAHGTDFGAALVGLQTVTNVFAVTNAGTGTLTFSSVATNGSESTSFTLLDLPATLAAGATNAFSVVFDPIVGGTNAATFTFHFDGTNSPYTVHMEGIGLGGAIALSTNELSITGTYYGSDPSARTLSLYNTGAPEFNWTHTIAYCDGAADWLTVTPPNGMLGIDGQISLTNAVALTNLSAGTYFATNHIWAADATNSPQSYVIQLNVTQRALTITATPQRKKYGETLTGQTGYTLFTVGEDQLAGSEEVTTVTVSYLAGHTSDAAAGVYENAIVLSGAVGSPGFSAANYEIDFISGVLTVDPWIQASAGEYGAIDPDGETVVPYGDAQLFNFMPDPWYAVQDVWVNGVSQGAISSFNWQNVLATGTITVHFAEAYVTNNTPVAVPELWMSHFGLTNDMDTLVQQDLGFGVETWKIYVMDANPTNGVGLLRLDSMQLGETNRVEWIVSSNRVYTLYDSTNLHHGVTNWVMGPFQPLESGVWSHEVPVHHQERSFYRVTVELP